MTYTKPYMIHGVLAPTFGKPRLNYSTEGLRHRGKISLCRKGPRNLGKPTNAEHKLFVTAWRFYEF